MADTGDTGTVANADRERLDAGDEPPSWAEGLQGFELRAEKLADGEPIPKRFTADGEDLSPALAWGPPPAGTKSLALLMEDPDAPSGLFTHWMVLGLPPRPGDLVEGRGTDPTDVAGATTLVNDAGEEGWCSPAPPRGKPHRYVFRLLALDAEPSVAPGGKRAAFDRAVDGHVIAEARLLGTYGR